MGSISFEEREFITESIDLILRDIPTGIIILCPRYTYTIPIFERLLKENKISTIRLSEVSLLTKELENNVLIVDRFGILNQLYAISNVSIVGGSFKKRYHTGFSQNLIEPMIQGKPVLYGQYTLQFDDLVNGINQDHNHSICFSASELTEKIKELFLNKSIRQDLIHKQISFLKNHSGTLENYSQIVFSEIQKEV